MYWPHAWQILCFAAIIKFWNLNLLWSSVVCDRCALHVTLSEQVSCRPSATIRLDCRVLFSRFSGHWRLQRLACSRSVSQFARTIIVMLAELHELLAVTVESGDSFVPRLDMYSWDQNHPRHYNDPDSETFFQSSRSRFVLGGVVLQYFLLFIYYNAVGIVCSPWTLRTMQVVHLMSAKL